MRLVKALVSLTLLIGSTAQGSDQPGKIPITASIIPLGYLCERIGGERVEIQVLIPPGASPHVFEPKASVLAEAARARLFVYVGEGLEPWAHRIMRSKGKHAVVVEAARGVPLIRDVQSEGGTHHKQGKPHLHKHGGGNPHIWLDPIIMQGISKRIHDALVSLDPEGKSRYDENLIALLRDLEALHEEIRERVSRFRIKEYVCFHSAFIYFSQRYGLREIGVIELAPGREPSPKHIRKIIEAIKLHSIRAVFAEPQLNPRVAEVIARDAGVRVALLDPLGGREPYGKDYLALMRHNLKTMEEVMTGD